MLAAYENVRDVPESPLFRELDEDECFPPRSHAIVLDQPGLLEVTTHPPPDLFPDITDKNPSTDQLLVVDNVYEAMTARQRTEAANVEQTAPILAAGP